MNQLRVALAAGRAALCAPLTTPRVRASALHVLPTAMCVLVVTLGIASGVGAQDRQSVDDEQARIHFQSGQGHYRRGDYEAALREFEAAYQLSRRPALLYNIYLMQERVGQLETALQTLDSYLETDAVPASDRREIEERREHLVDRIARQSASGATLAASAPRELEPSPPTAAPSGAADGLRIASIVSFAVGGLGLAMFAGFGAATLAEDGRLADACGSNAGRSCSRSELSGLAALAALADTGWVLALAGAAAGLTLWLVADGEENGDVAVAAWADDHGVGIWMVGSL